MATVRPPSVGGRNLCDPWAFHLSHHIHVFVPKKQKMRGHDALSRSFRQAALWRTTTRLEKSSLKDSFLVTAKSCSSNTLWTRNAAVHVTTSRPFSVTDGGSFNLNPFDWWRNREAKKNEDEFKKRIEAMANQERWILDDLYKDLKEGAENWRNRIPGVSSTKEVQGAKKMYNTIKGLISVVGSNATYSDLENMSKIDKLRAAHAGEVTVEEVNVMIQQCGTLRLMQSLVRKRKLEGRPLPTTPENLQVIAQQEGRTMLTKKQLAKLQKISEKTHGLRLGKRK